MIRCAAVLVASLAVGLPLFAQGTRGPIAELPSRPGAHVEKIKAMGDNEWLNLGSPAADPKWGKARGRSWSSNMPFAPDLRGGFVFAEGVHAYTKPDGRYMNDVWFYDANAHRWVCLYPGIEVKTVATRIKDKELALDADGLLVESDGQPLPPLLIHAYGYLGYDTDRRKFAFLGSQFGICATISGLKPEPSSTPMTDEIPTTVRPTNNEMRAPASTREKISRPSSSRPNGCERLGRSRRSARCCSDGSYGAAHGAMIAPMTVSSTMAAPILITIGLRGSVDRAGHR